MAIQKYNRIEGTSTAKTDVIPPRQLLTTEAHSADLRTHSILTSIGFACRPTTPLSSTQGYIVSNVVTRSPMCRPQKDLNVIRHDSDRTCHDHGVCVRPGRVHRLHGAYERQTGTVDYRCPAG
jgi:hypothetical protein